MPSPARPEPRRRRLYAPLSIPAVRYSSRCPARRPGHQGARADDFTAIDDESLVVGIHWIADDGSQGEPLAFQLVSVRDGWIVHVQDYRRKEQALKAARKR